jgi:K+-transporting ATPase KdpF subunit
MKERGAVQPGGLHRLVAVGYAYACLRRTKMAFDYTLAAIVAAGLLCYLIYALLRPERF